MLAKPEEGIRYVESLGAGLKKYLSPHCEKTRTGSWYLSSPEARAALQVCCCQSPLLATLSVNVTITKKLLAMNDKVPSCKVQ